MWVEAGQDPATFHTFTLSEVNMIVRAASARREAERMAEFERQRALNHQLAGLISFAFHSPKDMPEYEPLQKNERHDEAPTEADTAALRGFFIFHAARTSQ